MVWPVHGFCWGCRYVRSRSDKQLAGVGPADSPGNRGICSPEEFLGGSQGQANPAVNNSNVVKPCGLIAWSNFNDTISLPGFNVRVSTALFPWYISWYIYMGMRCDVLQAVRASNLRTPSATHQ